MGSAQQPRPLTPVRTPPPSAPPADVEALLELVVDLGARLAAAEGRLDAMQVRRADADAWQADVLARLDALEARPTGGARPSSAAQVRADLDERILAFMRANPLRLTALVIADNMPGNEENTRIGHRLAALAQAGKIGTDKPDGSLRRYFWKQATS